MNVTTNDFIPTTILDTVFVEGASDVILLLDPGLHRGVTMAVPRATITIECRGDMGDCVIQAEGGSPMFEFLFGGSMTMKNMVLSGSNSGAIYVDGDATIRLDATTISGNSAENGGGIYNDGGNIYLDNECIISGNSANAVTGKGGGIYNSGGGTVTLGDGTIISDNQAAESGGIYNEEGFLTLDGDIIVCGNSLEQAEPLDGHGGSGKFVVTNTCPSFTEAPVTAAPVTEPPVTHPPVGPPMENCVDRTNWVYEKDGVEKNCDWVAAKPYADATQEKGRCERLGKDLTKAKEACPVACGGCPCTDSCDWKTSVNANSYDVEKGCSWVAQLPYQDDTMQSGRCFRTSNDLARTPAKDACLVACGRLCTPCEDDALWTFTNENRKEKNCAWVARLPYKNDLEEKGRCFRKGDNDGRRAIEACPVACGTCA